MRTVPEGFAAGPLYPEGPDLVILGHNFTDRQPRKLPGIARINGAGVGYHVDAKQAKGKSAVRPSYHGLDTARTFSIEWWVWTNEQRIRAQQVALELAPNRVYAAGKGPNPQIILNDAIEHLDITHVTVENVSQWTYASDGDRCTITVRAWYPAEKKRGPSKPTPQYVAQPNALRDKAQNPSPSSRPNAGGPR